MDTKTDNWIPEEEEAFFSQYEGIVYKVLKDLSIHRLHLSYDDLLQNGRIKLFEAYEEMIQSDLFPEGFVGYAYRKIRWALLDILRKEQKHQQTQAAWTDELNELLPSGGITLIDHICEVEWIHSLWKQLTDLEKLLVFDLVFLQLSVTDAAKKQNISRKTIYARRQKIQSKLAVWKDSFLKG